MLKIAKSLRQLRFGALAALCTESIAEEQALYAYLHEDFFSRPGDTYCIWEEKGRYLSCLRLQNFRDGLLLDGLFTDPAYRGQGCAKRLIRAVLAEVKPEKLYAHIHRKNAASIAVHEGCGFQKILDYAVYADGSVLYTSDTYLYENPRCT